MNGDSIRVLLVEDNPADVRLVQEVLVESSARFRITHVDRLDKALASLREESFDVILLDLSLPDSQGLETFRQVRTAMPALPILVLTYHQDEALALQTVQRGAQDFLTKGHEESRYLGRSIRYAIERKQAEERLRESNEQYRALFESNPIPMWVFDPIKASFVSVNEAAIHHYGYSRDEILSMTPRSPSAPEELASLLKYGSQISHQNFEAGFSRSGEWTLRTKSGVLITAQITWSRMTFHGKTSWLISAHDISDRKRVEETLKRSEQQLAETERLTRLGSWRWDIPSNQATWSDELYRIFSLKPQSKEITSETYLSYIHPEDREQVKRTIEQSLENRGSFSCYHRIVLPDGSSRLLHLTGAVVTDAQGRAIHMVGTAQDITERKWDEEALKESHQLFQAVIEGIPDTVYVKDLQGRYILINSAGARRIGKQIEEIIGKTDEHLFVSHTTTSLTNPQMTPAGEIQTFEETEQREGILRTYLTTKILRRNPQDEIIGLIGISREITEQKQSEESLRFHVRQQTALAELGQHALGGLDFYALLDKAAALVTRALETEYAKILELLPEGKTLLLRAGVGWKEGLIRTATLPANTESQGGYTLLTNAPVIVEDLRTEDRFTPPALLREHGVVSGLSVVIPGTRRPFGTLSVHTARRRLFTQAEVRFLQVVANLLATAIERRRAEETIQHQAYYDALTGLPNRSLLEDHLALAISQADRHNDMVALMFLDLDCFKEVNDTLGHPIGDQLLKAVSERLAACVRDGDTFARMGGDEFTILLPEIDAIEKVTRVAERVLEALIPAFRIAGQELPVSASIGIALYPQAGRDPETLLRNADTALYRAKKQRKNTFCFFSPTPNEKMTGERSIENSLRQALEREEFLLHYQPQIDLKSRRIVGLETLIRWRRPDATLVSAADFIPLAEKTGLIVPIGEWVLRTACAQNRKWQDAGLPPLRVGVNLSARQFYREDLSATVSRVLADTGLAPGYLELELTEKILMRKEESLVAMLRKLAAMGIVLTIDDFGTGYSSLTHLKRFPISKLKIDQSFVRNITTDSNNATIAKTVVEMAHSLQMKGIAEGVEAEEEMEFLHSIECDEMQGYLFSRPLPADETERLLARGAAL
ncbi:MAG: EAL domain-containing protein [Candidatus Manganitrophus sp.]|nr:EAL domain-containing protein [Candidatus Manganitrophus sp.]